MFQYRLALALGRTRRELLAGMDAQEYLHWLAFDRLSPIGAERLDALAGSIAAAGVNKWVKDESKTVDPLDLVPDWGGLRAEQERRQRRQRQKQDRAIWRARAQAREAEECPRASDPSPSS